MRRVARTDEFSRRTKLFLKGCVSVLYPEALSVPCLIGRLSLSLVEETITRVSRIPGIVASFSKATQFALVPPRPSSLSLSLLLCRSDDLPRGEEITERKREERKGGKGRSPPRKTAYLPAQFQCTLPAYPEELSLPLPLFHSL